VVVVYHPGCEATFRGDNQVGEAVCTHAIKVETSETFSE